MQVLSETVTRYDTQEEPVTPEELAETVEGDIETVRGCFEEFESKHLLKCVEGGYRPTVTARELLELDVPDSTLLVLDVEPEERGDSPE